MRPELEYLQLIAEIGQAHDGSLGQAHAYIDALAQTGVTAVKFQVHIAEAESSPFETFRVNFSFEDETRYDYWRRMEFTPAQWIGLKAHCDEKGVEFLASPFSLRAVELLERVGVQRYKVGSGEVSNLLMLDRIARTGKPVILSSGLSTYAHLDATMAFLAPYKNHISILQCTTSYPTRPEELGLNVIGEIKSRYGCPTGLSDHSGAIYPGIAAVALGAELLEFHAVFDRRSFGPDARASLEIAEVSELVAGARVVATALAHPMDKTQLASAGLRNLFGKSLAVNRTMSAGETIALDDLESKKPADRGIPASRFREVVGRRLANTLEQWDFLSESDLSQTG